MPRSKVATGDRKLVANPGSGKRRGRPSRKITAKQAIWVAEYLKDMNGTRAAEVANYRHPSVAGAKLLNPGLYPHVVEAVGMALADKQEACGIEARRIVEELARIGFLNPKQLVDRRGHIRELKDLPDEVAAGIEKMEVSSSESDDGAKFRRVHIRFHDKLSALRQMSELLGYRRPPPPISQNNLQVNVVMLSEAARNEAITKILTESNKTVTVDTGHVSNEEADATMGEAQLPPRQAMNGMRYGLKELPAHQDAGDDGDQGDGPLADDVLPLY